MPAIATVAPERDPRRGQQDRFPGWRNAATRCSAAGIWLVVCVRSSENSSTQQVCALPSLTSAGS
ncbi:hypothetical protein [Pseudomonas sp. TH10]|uniref:hypothetical protein n=1 Tax=Pseudomonas sp. TH10 TaxID=2796376 RepID=UPI001F5BC1E1|nr:hypothetical protein [Pseudomonas sp. TH10]